MAETILVNAATVTAAASCAVADMAVPSGTEVMTFRIECDQPHTLKWYGAATTFDDTANAAEYADERRTYVSATSGTGNLYLVDPGSMAYIACVVTNNGTASATVTVGAEASANEAIAILTYKTVTDPATGKMTIYDANGDEYLSASIYEDATGVTPYRNSGINRREALT